MKSKVTQMDVARACKLDQGSVSRILNKNSRDSFAPETVRYVFKIARELGYVHPTLVSTNRRSSQRLKTMLKARLKIVTGPNDVFDEGVADVDEVSASGMRIRNLRTSKSVLPIDHFRFDIRIEGPKLKGFACRARLVRFSESSEDMTLAVRYENLSDENLNRIKSYLKS